MDTRFSVIFYNAFKVVVRRPRVIRRSIVYSCVLVFNCLFLSAQTRVEPRNMYERVLAIVPIVGAGTWADPQRPMFAPIPAHMKPSDRSGIIAFHHQISDDGKFALVEYVTANKGALASVLTLLNQGATTAGIQVFERGKSTPAQIEAAFKAKKKDFDLNRFQVAVQ